MPKYSIIIPFYNVRPYVRDCLDSLLAQEFKNWEAVCVDDGSPDGLGEVLDEYAIRDNRIKVVHQKNCGVCAARNVALERICGEWIVFIDGDDVLAPWHLTVCEKGASQFPWADMIAFGAKEFPEFETCDWSNGPGEIVFCARERIEIVDQWYNSGGMWMRVYRRSVFGDIRFRNMVKGQDLMYLAECVYRCRPLARTACVCGGYRQRAGSTMHTPVTFGKLKAAIEYASSVFDLIGTSRVPASYDIIKTYLNGITEKFCYDLCALQDKTERSELLCAWSNVIRMLAKKSIVSGFQQMRLSIVSKYRGRFVRYVLCELPHRMKLLGIHR